MPPIPSDSDVSAKLDQMVLHLQRMDNRDRLRTWGGFFRSILHLIPIILVLWSTWYIYKHGDELMKKIAEESAKQAAKYTQEQSQSIMEKMQNLLPQNGR